jgi:DNA-binding transcriptional regulator YhcF (GntR family)
LEAVRRVRTVDVVSQRLLSAIARGEFQPGTRLPPERELASVLQVSRNMLREAVRQLETMGVIVVRQGNGTYVAEAADGFTARNPLELLALADTNVLDLMEARQAIEIKAASLAAYSGEIVHVVRRKTSTRSGSSHPAVPGQIVHLFRLKESSSSGRPGCQVGAKRRSVWTHVPWSVVRCARCSTFLIDSPLKRVLCELWTRRSRTASATDGSRMDACQSSTGSWLAMIVQDS